MKARQCQWCGESYESAHPAKLYCSAQCKLELNNFMATVGKRIAAEAMCWRRGRGKAGTPAESLKRLTRLLDEANGQFRDQRPKGAPSIQDYIEAVNKPTGIRRGIDR